MDVKQCSCRSAEDRPVCPFRTATDDVDAVFFGPDTYRHVPFLAAATSYLRCPNAYRRASALRAERAGSQWLGGFRTRRSISST